MSEYNYVPDYAAWWRKDDVTKEQLCWLALGINPNDVEKQIAINQKAQSDHEEIVWGGQFTRYTINLPQGLWLGDAHKWLIRCVEQGETKADFVKNLYDFAHEFPPSFKGFLLQLKPMPVPTTYDRYLDDNIFKPIKMDHILLEAPDELTAFANILGLEEKSFYRMIVIKDKEKDLMEKDEEVFWEHISPDDRHFITAYQNFLKKDYPYFAGSDNFLYQVWTKVKDLNLWHGDVSEYINALHNGGFIFTDVTYSRISASGIHLGYTDDGWAVQFYKRWIEKGLWTLEEAVTLFLGSSPSGGREFVGLANTKPDKSGRLLLNAESMVFIDEKGGMENTPGSRNGEISLKQCIADHVAAGLLNGISVPGYDGFKFKPIDIVKFFRDYCPNTYQPKALFQAFELINTNDNPNKSDLESDHREYDFTAMSKADREKIVLNYAYDIWKNNNFPRMGWVKQEIKNNPYFRNGDISWGTICKPVTEEKLAELQSRKIAQNRAKNTF